MTILYFTATGNSLQVAKAFGGTLKSIPQLLRAEEFLVEDDIIGIVCPIYAMNLPNIVVRYLSKAKLKANYIFGVLTCGKVQGNASASLEKLLANNNAKLDYANVIKMADNYLPFFKMENELMKLSQKNVNANIETILKDISARKQFIPNNNIVFKLLSKMTDTSKSEKVVQNLNNSDKSFSVNEKCNQCGLCTKVCPVDNIVLKSKPQFQHRCETCFACIHNCPQNAIHLKNEKSSVRFRNENVAVNEIIQSNSKK